MLSVVVMIDARIITSSRTARRAPPGLSMRVPNMSETLRVRFPAIRSIKPLPANQGLRKPGKLLFTINS